MNEYVFYTTEGVTLPPKGDEVVDNCQILGFVKAKNISEAKDLLLEDNPWIVETGFSISETSIDEQIKRFIRQMRSCEPSRKTLSGVGTGK